MRNFALAFLVSGFTAPLFAQNLILNGDFEAITRTGCLFNQSNTSFDQIVSDCTAYGAGNEICVMNDPAGCGYGSAPTSGQTKLGIAVQYPSTTVDEFSMHLRVPVLAGAKYRLTFDVEAVIESFSPTVGDMEIGLSADPASFGTLIMTTRGVAGGGFVTRSLDFTAPVDAGYLTVRMVPGTDSWNHVDSFSLTTTAQCVTRNGSGVNPVDYICSTAPQIGSNYLATIAVTAGTQSTAIAFGFGPATIPVGSAEVLLATTPTPILVTANGAHAVSIPNVSSLIGAPLWSQGFRFETGPSLVLLNAIDLVIGA